MMKRALMMSALATAMMLSAGLAPAADPTLVQGSAQTREQVYGSELMTTHERVKYRAKLRAARTVGEREKIRKAHHEVMKGLASERGVSLADEPPVRGSGMGGGSGLGPGDGGAGLSGGRPR
jgi:outer membrane PBP1 activator LpoA protein